MSILVDTPVMLRPRPPVGLGADSIAVLIKNFVLEDICFIRLRIVNWNKVTSQSDLEMIK